MTGDDMSKVKLFNYPVVHDDAPWKEYHGGASFITCVRFNADDRKVIAVGGNDHTIFQYRTHGVNPDDLQKPEEVAWYARAPSHPGRACDAFGGSSPPRS